MCERKEIGQRNVAKNVETRGMSSSKVGKKNKVLFFFSVSRSVVRFVISFLSCFTMILVVDLVVVVPTWYVISTLEIYFQHLI